MKEGEINAIGTFNELVDNPILIETLKIHQQNKDTNGQRETVAEDSKISMLDSFAQEEHYKVNYSNNLASEIIPEPVPLKKQPSEKTTQQMIEDGKILEDEEDEIITVEAKTYLRYMRLSGGWCSYLFLNLLLVGFILTKIYGDYLIGDWSEHLQTGSYADFKYYTYMVFGFSLANTVFTWLRVWVMQFGSLKASKIIHQQMIARVLQAPINLFFDVTPMGKILNRFSKDLDTVDTQLGFQIGTVLTMFYQGFATILVAALAVPWIAIIYPILFYVFFKLFRFSIHAQREVQRLASVAESPILSFLQETSHGVSTLRSYKKNKAFITKNMDLLDRKIVSYQVYLGV